MMRAGAPSLKFLEAMEDEHCHSFDSDQTFETSNYHIATTPRAEWLIVVRCDASKADMRFHRRIPSIQELRELPISQSAQLDECEVIAVVIYTGPMVRARVARSRLACAEVCASVSLACLMTERVGEPC
jgi:hypothetical protein